MTGPQTARASAAARRCLSAALASVALATPGGCAGLYFRDVAPAAPVRYEIANLPFREYWTGIVFNGEKIGFSRFTIRQGRQPGRHEIRSEASFVLRFLGIEKKVNLKAHDTIADDLTLVEFAYEYHIDGSDLKVSGRRDGNELVASIVSGGKPNAQRLPVEGKLYPSSVIALYPVVHGLEPGREYAYRVYNGEVQAILDVVQRVTGYQSSAVFTGTAFKVETAMHGHRVTTWIGRDGRPVFELALRGAMINALEDETSAKRYLALATLNKKESLIEFSLVRPDRPVDNPRAASALRVALRGLDRPPPSDGRQSCVPQRQEIVCEIRRGGNGAPQAVESARERHLRPSVTVQSNDPSIRRLAEEIVAGASSTPERIARLLRWLDAHIEKAPLDVFSALDVLERRKAECQGHAYLYAALARAAGIPTRVVNGLVYSQEPGGFLYHSWAESLDGARWIAVDPTFGQAEADATHIKLLEGEALADLMPLLDWVGKLGIRVLAVEHQPHDHDRTMPSATSVKLPLRAPAVREPKNRLNQGDSYPPLVRASILRSPRSPRR
jgi:transglutaminase-like putative cysteine protease